MRWAGIDHLVITGRASKPVYLYIEDSTIAIRDAGHLWGLGTDETIARMRAGEVPPGAGIACIGPAGENGVRYASIIATEHRAAGRTGSGCVAGAHWALKGEPGPINVQTHGGDVLRVWRDEENLYWLEGATHLSFTGVWPLAQKKPKKEPGKKTKKKKG